MTELEKEDLLDMLLVRSTDYTSFNKLNEKQKSLSILELFISSLMRSGVESFFEEIDEIKFCYVKKSMQLIGANEFSLFLDKYSFEKLNEEIILKIGDLFKLQENELSILKSKYIEKDWKILSENIE